MLQRAVEWERRAAALPACWQDLGERTLLYRQPKTLKAPRPVRLVGPIFPAQDGDRGASTSGELGASRLPSCGKPRHGAYWPPLRPEAHLGLTRHPGGPHDDRRDGSPFRSVEPSPLPHSNRRPLPYHRHRHSARLQVIPENGRVRPRSGPRLLPNELVATGSATGTACRASGSAACATVTCVRAPRLAWSQTGRFRSYAERK